MALQASHHTQSGHAVEGHLPDKRKPLYPFHNNVPEDLRVEADVGRLEQVLGNLLDNAVKYSPDGGAIEVLAERLGREIVVAICDHGLGMDEKSRSRLFERFVRVGNTGLVAGTGLGLWIVRSLVELLGGHIDVTGAPGEGSTFRFTLPAA